MSIDHSKNIVEVKNVSFSYFNGNIVLKDVNLNIHYGDYLGIIGPNGGGKSTLVNLILGLLKPDSGTIKVYATSIGYVPQKATEAIDAKFPVTVYNVVSMGRFAKKGFFRNLDKEDRDAVDKALEQVKMTDYKNRLIGNLSGGQEQKVIVARALARDAQIIFLDEPTSGVDEASQEEFYELLDKLNKELGITLVLVSHDIDVVTREVTEVAAINRTVIYYGSSKEFIKEEHHDRLYLKGLKFIGHHG
ncbi:zinc ABC transporter ATP-binding protein [Candidatus Woesebacteria bacterium RIFCSPHIGHO2_02_FULL_38_9]|uniref:Zinc ABC transporter ATP-binding protein n=1 Tax=Candidatus Woesebacteria bacterium RIFCSPHIGHO2_01_FULL_39_28 TaxID=1802496 RepID=A0A1F7YGW7_9BACT|nr:MAG: zinc ABC transporter ATP-binding protein [Candidatus Woesebacteria bacterium RIFCSPHIGHO2_01_FULL_39_28]OGM32574.1 MAG: zinc ABC transporter ATP-binding protein [Candidatus Woesebacteria bacterium RIFCSPHIGHO2_02_FULL_38_9]OGM58738.1 MAG: zinc ABC transporter ATP-binding protein [Candidatus Woesebacteria bacterium RIFCSPLOWO2_01_FULL_38_20]